MKTNTLVLFLACGAYAFAANGPMNRGMIAGNADAAARNGPAVAGSGPCDASCASLLTETSPVTLSAAAQSALLFQIDEERMARELFTSFGAKWGLRPFQSIPQSESRHEAVLRQLAMRAGVTAPATVAGRFASAEVQQRYDALLALGLESADSALRAAAFVEEQDIADLRALRATADSAELQEVVAVLERASGHHLAAFVRALTTRGVSYTPQVLAPDEFAALSASGPGEGGMGRGRGYRGGR